MEPFLNSKDFLEAENSQNLFETSKYVSVIKFKGISLPPPVMTVQRIKEMRNFKQLAIEIENKLIEKKTNVQSNSDEYYSDKEEFNYKIPVIENNEKFKTTNKSDLNINLDEKCCNIELLLEKLKMNSENLNEKKIIENNLKNSIQYFENIIDLEKIDLRQNLTESSFINNETKNVKLPFLDSFNQNNQISEIKNLTELDNNCIKTFDYISINSNLEFNEILSKENKPKELNHKVLDPNNSSNVVPENMNFGKETQVVTPIKEKPKLIRSNSYTLESPSPILMKYLADKKIDLDMKSENTIPTNKKSNVTIGLNQSPIQTNPSKIRSKSNLFSKINKSNNSNRKLISVNKNFGRKSSSPYLNNKFKNLITKKHFESKNYIKKIDLFENQFSIIKNHELVDNKLIITGKKIETFSDTSKTFTRPKNKFETENSFDFNQTDPGVSQNNTFNPNLNVDKKYLDNSIYTWDLKNRRKSWDLTHAKEKWEAFENNLNDSMNLIKISDMPNSFQTRSHSLENVESKFCDEIKINESLTSLKPKENLLNHSKNQNDSLNQLLIQIRKTQIREQEELLTKQKAQEELIIQHFLNNITNPDSEVSFSSSALCELELLNLVSRSNSSNEEKTIKDSFQSTSSCSDTLNTHSFNKSPTNEETYRSGNSNIANYYVPLINNINEMYTNDRKIDLSNLLINTNRDDNMQYSIPINANELNLKLNNLSNSDNSNFIKTKLPLEIFHVPQISHDFIKKYQIKKAVITIQAFARGYLVRRLYRTQKVQDLIKVICDTASVSSELYKENIKNKSEEVLLKQSIHQIQSSLSNLHDIFFKLSKIEQMKIIELDRKYKFNKMLKIYSTRSENQTSPLLKQEFLKRKVYYIESRPKTSPNLRRCQMKSFTDRNIEYRSYSQRPVSNPSNKVPWK